MKFSTRDLVRGGIAVALIAVCSWIHIPATVDFTLQTMAVFLTVGLLGGKLGTLAVVAYILLGAIGVPVFAGFHGGLGTLLGTTGGYIIGFVFSALVMWAVVHRFGEGPVPLVCGMAAGLLVCYIFGTAWFMVVYARANGPISLGTALGWCVFPFVIPDAAKIAVAALLTRRLKPLINR